MIKKMNNVRNLILKKSCIGVINLFLLIFFFGLRINGWFIDCCLLFFECFKFFRNNLVFID